MSDIIKRMQLNPYMMLIKKKIDKTTEPRMLRKLKKLLRGARRRRNWLMRTGQCPPRVFMGAWVKPIGTDVFRRLGDVKSLSFKK